MRTNNYGYNPFLHLCTGIFCVILWPFYMLFRLVNFLLLVSTAGSALLYLVFLIYDIYTIIRDGFSLPGDIILPIGVGVIIFAIYFVVTVVSEFLKTALTIPVNLYVASVEKFRAEKISKSIKIREEEILKEFEKKEMQSTEPVYCNDATAPFVRQIK